MNEWRSGYGETRDIFQLDGKFFCFQNSDPEDGSLTELTEDYRDEDGNFIPPEVLGPPASVDEQVRLLERWLR